MVKYKGLELRPRMIAIMVLLYAKLERNALSAPDLADMIGVSTRTTANILELMKGVGLVVRREYSDSDPAIVWKLTDDGEEWLQEHN